MSAPIDARHLSPEMTMTMVMLLGGTPIVLYGQELGLDQVKIADEQIDRDNNHLDIESVHVMDI